MRVNYYGRIITSDLVDRAIGNICTDREFVLKTSDAKIVSFIYLNNTYLYHFVRWYQIFIYLIELIEFHIGDFVIYLI